MIKGRTRDMAKDTFINMNINKVIVHQIFKRDLENHIIKPFYSTECIALNTGFNTKLKERIVKSLGRESHSIRMQIEDDGEESVFHYICQYWDEDDTDISFINTTKEITEILINVQDNRRYPDALVIYASGTVQQNSKDFFCIIKAESQDGFLINKDSDKIGLNYIDNLFMTKNEKLQKLGFFIKTVDNSHNITKELVDAYIFDSNTNASVSKAKAFYFYNNFLGLNFRNDSKKQTLNFFSYTKKFVNSRQDLNDIQKINLSTQLIQYITAQQTPILNAADFANDFLNNAQMKDEYLRYLEEKDVPTISIYKDTSMLGNMLKYRQLYFSNNVRLQIPVESFKDIVEITKDENGETIIKIKGMMLDEK